MRYPHAIIKTRVPARTIATIGIAILSLAAGGGLPASIANANSAPLAHAAIQQRGGELLREGRRPPVPTAAMLRAALLTVAQLPLGFEIQPADTGSDSDAKSLLKACPYAGVGQVNPKAQAQTAFSARISGTFVAETLLQYPVSAAKAQLKEFANAANVCSSFSLNVQGLVVKIDISVEAFPRYGDQTVALRISADLIRDRNRTVESDLVAVRHGGTVILIGNTADPLDPTLTRAVVSSAYAKVASRW